MPTARVRDPNGFLFVRGCPLTSEGIFDYSAGQLGLPGDPNRIVKVYRPASAFNSAESIATFKDIPLIDDHEMLSGFADDTEAAAPEDYGVSGVLTSNIYVDGPWLKGDIKVFSRDMQMKLAGKKELSLGYACDFEQTPGVWNGQPYEVVQTNMRGNHIALVERARVPGARVLDGLCFDHLNFVVVPSKSDEVKPMKRKQMDNAVQQLKALLPALEQYLNEEATEPAHAGAASGEGGEGAPAAAAPAAAPAVSEENKDAVAADPVVAAEGEADPAAAADPAASEPAADPAADPAAAPAAAAEPAQSVEALVAEVEQVLAKLKAAMAGSDPAPAAAEAGDEGEMNGEGELSTDSVEGLQGEHTAEGAAVCADDGEGAGVGEGQGKASPGPAAGLHAKANDAALQHFYADLAAKTSLYDRLSPLVGAFDHKAMDSRAVAVYGVKKLGLKVKAGTETIALDAYLTGASRAKQNTSKQAQARVAQDAAATSEIDNYLSGAK